MLNRSISILSFILFSVFISKANHLAEYISSYQITKRSTDTSIAKGKSAFQFTFKAPFGRKLVSTISVDVNGENHQLKPDSSGKAVLVLIKGKHGIHTSTYDYEEIRMDTILSKSQERIEIKVEFEMDDEPRPMKKPVIYVYSPQSMSVEIELDVEGELLFTYPVYSNKWSFSSSHDGTITMNGNLYNYLFWEGSDAKYIAQEIETTEGFVVTSDKLLLFLENSLAAMGLNSKEMQDFITFWYPQMIKNEKNNIRFMFNAACDAFAKINVTPKPNNVFRVSMVWSASTNEIEIGKKPQIFPKVNRNGFYLIEWGGVEVEEPFIGN
jgi:hypothetical protein